MLREISKSALLAAAIACITAGVKLLDTDVSTAIVLIVVGAALIVLYAYLLEIQTVEKALKTLRKELGKNVGKGCCEKH